MELRWIFLALAVAIVAQASSLDNFSNNLATDVGPLLALFGERITTQYFSESTSFVDYFIFAMAPLGIITAVTSVIRVCGDSSLRAFIGRAQEGDGEIEAELCTSTSRDVCELFHKGGITRVFGKPTILEILHLRGGEENEPQDHADQMGTYLFRYYLHRPPKDPVWEAKASTSRLPSLRLPKPLAPSLRSKNGDEEGGTKSRSSANTSSAGPDKPARSKSAAAAPDMLVQNPNISINVGIAKLPKWAFWLVGLVGFVLQCGVIVMAAVIEWKLEWTQDGAPESLTNVQAVFAGNRSPLSFIIGTVLMCGGMFWCAALIGESTEERQFQRMEKRRNKESRLFWLQPGKQLVGEETFDAYAFVENKEKKPILEYTSSTKKKAGEFYVYTWMATILTLGGYIAQFVGLRGMNASVSIAQLGITLFMSFLRGCLRMRRLDRTDNKLVDRPDMVVGHELDWLAFSISKDDVRSFDLNDENLSWLVTGQPVLLDQNRPQHVDPPSSFERLLKYRSRLAHLTGHHPLHALEPYSFQSWEDSQIIVRTKAQEIARALCGAAEAIQPLASLKSSTPIILGVEVGMSTLDQHREIIEVAVTPAKEGSPATWVVDSARLEGILGLWLWSLKCADGFCEDDPHGNKDTSAESIPNARIVSSFAGGDASDALDSMTEELDLWMGQDVLKPVKGTLHSQSRLHDCSTPWVTTGDKNWRPGLWSGREELEADETGAEKESPPRVQWRRFFGWQTIPSFSASQKLTPEAEIHVLYTPSRNKLLTECSQELYAALLSSMVSSVTCDFGDVTVAESSDPVRLENRKLSAIVSAFAESQLGTRSDAILCVIPCLRQYLKPTEGYASFPSLMKAASKSRGRLAQKRVEALLEWMYLNSPKREVNPSGGSVEKIHIASGLVAMGEFYRKAFAHGRDVEDRNFGYKGIARMRQRYKQAIGQGFKEVQEVLDRYAVVTLQFAGLNREADLVPSLEYQDQLDSPPKDTEIVTMIRNKFRDKVLYILSVINPRDLLGSPSALPLAARNEWFEVVMALLELNVDINGQDDESRTAVSYYAERGDHSMTATVLQYGANPDLPDNLHRTPLCWAAEKGHRDIVKILRDTTKVSLDWLDSNGRSPFSLAAGAGHLEILRMLRDTGMVQINKADKSGRTPLSYAAANGLLPIVEELINDNRTHGTHLNTRDINGRTPLSWAAEFGQLKVVQKLIPNPNIDPNTRDKDWRTPLFWATEKGYFEVVQSLLGSKTLEPDIMDFYGLTPLARAAQIGHDKVVNELVRSSAVRLTRIVEAGRTAIWWAARNGHTEIVKSLLKNDSSLSDLADGAGRTPIWWAARNGHESIIEELLRRQADPGTNDGTGQTPLWWAAYNGHEGIVSRLLDTDVDTEAGGSIGRSPLSCSARNGHSRVVELLLDRDGVDVDFRDDNGRTALSLAAEKGHIAVVKILIEKGGALLHADDFEGITPLEWAHQGHCADMVELLTGYLQQQHLEIDDHEFTVQG